MRPADDAQKGILVEIQRVGDSTEEVYGSCFEEPAHLTLPQTTRVAVKQAMGS